LNSQFQPAFQQKTLNHAQTTSQNGTKRKEKAQTVKKRKRIMPLTDRVTFNAVLQKGNRVQIPKHVRWLYKLETKQILIVKVRPAGAIELMEEFYSHMCKDGRIVVPKLTLALFQDRHGSLVGRILQIVLEPAQGP
jgi:bifunctional DNA-binding transcriptional regulator/antitoxin component of YhaV-PrlF toxin-antitoxin module